MAIAQYKLEPKTSCEFSISLFGFEKKDIPIIGRIGVGGAWSEPFVLNWPLDQGRDQFRKARIEQLQRVREALVKSGFKKELLEGDDYCARLLGKMMEETTTEEAKKVPLEPFAGGLDVYPEILSNGLIRLDFASKALAENHEVYRGWFVINPKRFSPKRFQELLTDAIEVTRRGHGLQMEFGDRLNPWTGESSIYIGIIYDPYDVDRIPDMAASRKVLNNILGAFGNWILLPEK